jgi:hypothetical protein
VIPTTTTRRGYLSKADSRLALFLPVEVTTRSVLLAKRQGLNYGRLLVPIPFLIQRLVLMGRCMRSPQIGNTDTMRRLA